jgi:hypothetical protein
MDIDDPNRAKPRTDIELPRWKNEIMDKLAPTRAFASQMETLDPILA